MEIIHNLTITDFQSVCRFCLQRDISLKPIFKYENGFDDFYSDTSDKGIVKMISICTGLETIYTDGLPLFICDRCYNKLLASNTFRKQCIESVEFLKKLKIQHTNSLIKTEHELEHTNTQNDSNTEMNSVYIKEPYSNFCHFSDDYSNDNVKQEDEISIDVTKELDKSNNILSCKIICEPLPVLDKKETAPSKRKLVTAIDPNKPTKQAIETKTMVRKQSKPEQCDICGFISRSLKSHMFVHTQEKKFECDFCGKEFSLQASLKNHIFAHINISSLHRRGIRQIVSTESSTVSSESTSALRPVVHCNRRAPYRRVNSEKKALLIKLYENGKSIRESSEMAEININTAKSLINLYNKNDCVVVEKKCGGRRSLKLSSEILNRIEEIIEENPCITLKNIRTKILESKNIDLSKSTISNGLKALRITLKCASLHVDRRNSAETIEQRKNYAINFPQNAPQTSENIIFIDESEFNCHIRRTKARSKVNTPARITIPTGIGRNVSLIAAMNINGIVFQKIITNSTVNSNIFCEFLRGLFIKLEEKNITNAWLILDNASIHKSRDVRDLIGQTTHVLLFLPPYSPMMNPMEQVFSKTKFSARDMLADTMNNRSLVNVIEESVATVTSANCSNYYLDMSMKLPSAAVGEPL